MYRNFFCNSRMKSAWNYRHLSLKGYLIPLVNLAIIYFCRRPEFDAAALQNRNHLPSLDSLRWRVDVAISTRWVKLTHRISSCFSFLSNIMACTEQTPYWHLSPLQRFKRSLYQSAARSVPQAQSRMDLCLHLHYSADPPHPSLCGGESYLSNFVVFVLTSEKNRRGLVLEEKKAKKKRPWE